MDAPEAERIKLLNSASSTLITRPITEYRFFKHLGNFLQEKSAVIKQRAPSTNLLDPGSQISTRVEYWNLFLVGKSVSVVMVYVLINEVYYKLTCSLLKYKVENQKLFCNNQGRRTVKMCTIV
jgi:hypothetical protein